MRLRSRLRVVASLVSKGLGGADAVLWSPGSTRDICTSASRGRCRKFRCNRLVATRARRGRRSQDARHVLSRTLGDRVEASVQANQLLGQLLPRHLLIVPCLDLPELRQSFRGYVVRLGPLLYL